MNRIDRSTCTTVVRHLVRFVLPALLAGFVFALLGVYPFGEKTLLVADMNNEYIEYLAYMHQAIRGEGSILRSWSMGMGLNMLGLVAFYASSPFNLFIFILPLEWITEAVLIVLLLKIGLCGLTFSLLLEKQFPLPSLAGTALCTAYALISYNIAYSSNLMWLDGVAFLPLVVLGVEFLLKGKPGLFVFSLAVVFFTSYYIGYMIGFFSLLYFTAVWFSRKGGWRGYLRGLLPFFGGAALAAGLCAWLLLPAFLNLSHGQEALWNLPLSLRLEQPLAPLTAKFFPGAFDTLTDAGTSNLYCSMAGAGGGALYFFNRRIPAREKKIFGALTAILLLSHSCELLYLGWHAFEDPTWYPARFSFLLSFWLLYLSARNLCRLRGCRFSAAGWTAVLLTWLILEAAAGHYGFLDSPALWGDFILLATYLLLCAVALRPRARKLPGRRQRLSRRRFASAALLLLVCLESAWNGLVVVQGIDRLFHYRSRESYTSFRKQNLPLLQAVEDSDPGIYRTELVKQRNANGALALGYRSISHYSTTTDQSLNRLLKGMGYNMGIINELYFSPNTPLANGLLGIRYVLSEYPLPGYEPFSEGKGGVYQNPASFPLAFVAGEQALDFYPGEGENPFELQNRWLSALWGEPLEPYQAVEAVEERLHQIHKTVQADHIRYENTLRIGEAWVEWTVHNPQNREVYAYLPVYNRRYAQAAVQLSDSNQVLRELGYRNNTVLSLGSGGTVTLRLLLTSEYAHLESVQFYTLDQSLARDCANRAQLSAMEFSLFSDTRVQGEIRSEASGVLVTTFPYDKGWNVRVNGVACTPQRFAGVFLAWPVEEGVHQVDMRYRPPGLAGGVIISSLSLAALTAWCLVRRKKQRKAIGKETIW